MFINTLAPILKDPRNNKYFDIKNIFRMIDIDGNGTVDGYEIGRIISTIYNIKVSKN